MLRSNSVVNPFSLSFVPNATELAIYVTKKFNFVYRKNEMMFVYQVQRGSAIWMSNDILKKIKNLNN